MSDEPSWHAIRPWTPPLTLSVREVTSVSATFALSATINQPSPADLDSDLENDFEVEEQTQPEPSVISEALAKGLSVNVNDSPWQRVFIRIDDPADEAVIIIYGLMPGRQYDIDLGIIHARHHRRQITTEEVDSEPTPPPPPSGTPATGNAGGIIASPTPQVTTDTSTNPPAPPPFTIEDRLAQLNHTLSLLSAERDSLQTQIKAVRRDGQKADAAIRSEIEALKRASEKHAAAEGRAKQKILALQEAVKRAQAGAHAAEEQLAEVENSLPTLAKEREKREAEYHRVKREAERARKERESIDEKDKKQLDKLRTELLALTHKFEKLGGKREKTEGSVIPDLEEQLNQTRKELSDLEKEEELLAEEELAAASGLGAVGQDYTFQGLSRRRANTGGTTSNPGPISRPQRASDTAFSPVVWNTTTSRVRDPLLPGQLDSPQVHRAHPPPRRDSSLSSNGYPYPPGLGPYNHPEQLQSVAPPSPSSSSPDSPVSPYPPGLQRSPTSALSSRPSTFEGVPRNSPYVAPIQRPIGATVTRSRSGASTQSRHA